MSIKKNLVLGTAVGYGLAEVSIFIKSFRKYNRHDDLVLVVDSDLDVETAQFYFNNNVRFIIFEAYKYIPTHIQNSRYIKYLEFLLENWTNYHHVFLTDVRDAVFQGDIFEGLPEEYLYFFSEDKSDTIKDNPFNASWIVRNYSYTVLERIGGGLIYCSGTTLGDYKSIQRYLSYLLAQRDFAKFVELGGEADEQGPHNYLFYCSDLNITGKANGDIIATMGTTFVKSPHLISFVGDKYFLDSFCPKVLHQYDRDGEMIRYFRNKYS